MDEHTITCNTEIGRNREKVKNIKPIVPIKTPKGKMTRKSPAESPILLLSILSYISPPSMYQRVPYIAFQRENEGSNLSDLKAYGR